MFFNYFATVDLFRYFNQQFLSARCLPEETVACFATRFQNLVAKTHKDPNAATTRDAFLSGLPARLQEQLKIKAVEIETLSEFIAFAVRFESLEDFLNFQSERRKPSYARPSEDVPSSSELFCRYCRIYGHLIEACLKKSARGSSFSRNSAVNQSSVNPPIVNHPSINQV